MNQYQRMVSYLYEYKRGVKGVNVGYVRIEQRGDACRISLQMRSHNLGQLWDVAVFRQGKTGIRYYSIGTLTERNGDYRCRIDTDSANLMESGIDISEVDGIILYQDDSYYIATTWKNQGIRVGERKIWDPSERDDFDEPDLSGPEEGMDDSALAEEKAESQNGEQSIGQQSLEVDAAPMQPLSQEQTESSSEQDEMADAEWKKVSEDGIGTTEQQISSQKNVPKIGQKLMGRKGVSESGMQTEMQEKMPETLQQSMGQEKPAQTERVQNSGQSFMERGKVPNPGQQVLKQERTQNSGRQMSEQEREPNSELQLTEQERKLQSLEQKEEPGMAQQPQRQNGMLGMGARFPRMGSMPFFRRRPMGGGNVPMPIQMTGEWGNGNRQTVDSRTADHENTPAGERSATDSVQETEAQAEFEEQMQEQVVCRNCPFKRKNIDYGKRILMTFPVMRPFPNDQKHACVRIEPQDLGCLPMQMWTLANNHFLLQGYYCYRHLIFMETGHRGYALGVPGIYGRRESHQAEQFGFTQFRAICSGRQCEGAFGYWLMPLSC